MKKRTKVMIRTVVILIPLGLISIIILTPFFWMISLSLKPLSDIFVFPLKLIPRHATTENYLATFTNRLYLRSFFNSVLVATIVTSGSLLVSSLAGYGLAKFHFRFQNLVLLSTVIAIMIPIHVVIIPLFIHLVKIGLINSYYALILPFIASPWGVFLMRQFLLDIPDALVDSARIDGASELRIYWSIVLPLSRPVLVVLAVINFLTSWNQFIWPVVAIRDQELRVLPLYLAGFFQVYNINYSEMMAAAFVATLPILILFFSLQKQFISGLTYGSFR